MSNQEKIIEDLRNQLERFTKVPFRNVYINSNNKINTTDTHSDFLIKIEGDLSKYTEVAAIKALIPKTYYLVNQYNDTFTLEENSVQFTVTLDHGDYNRKNLASNLQTKLNAAGAYTYTVTYPASTAVETGKYTITVSGNGGIQPKLIFTDQIYEILGFDINSTNNFSADSLVSTNVIKLIPEDALFIHSTIVANDQDNILQAIFTSGVSSFGSIAFEDPNPDMSFKKIATHNSNIFRFYLSDENGRPIDLNGLNINIVLCFR